VSDEVALLARIEQPDVHDVLTGVIDAGLSII
jgi:hypothetical protein